MSKVLSLIVLIALGAGGYWLMTNYTFESLSPIESGAESAQAVSVRDAQLIEEDEEYIINVTYPQFGVPVVDLAIEGAVQASAKSVRDEAIKANPVAEGFRKYELFGTTQGTYVGPDVISARLVLAQDFGGAHPLPIILSFNFFRENGEEVTLGDALSLIGLSLEEMAAGAKRQLNERYSEMLIAPEGADALAENYSTFTISASAVTFIFQPYQLTAYAAGAPEVTFERVR
ncbi:MAG TPA: RsiV family protein [Candidatus Paceibacterota bacterium]